MYEWAAAVGQEFKMKGANMALAPGSSDITTLVLPILLIRQYAGIGLARVPTAGRNFEYLCGEDPILGAKLVGKRRNTTIKGNVQMHHNTARTCCP